MSEARHFPGALVSVVADDDGLVICALCELSVDPGEVYMILRIPGTYTWRGWCHRCTSRFAKHYVTWAAHEHPDWNDPPFFDMQSV